MLAVSIQSSPPMQRLKIAPPNAIWDIHRIRLFPRSFQPRSTIGTGDACPHGVKGDQVEADRRPAYSETDYTPLRSWRILHQYPSPMLFWLYIEASPPPLKTRSKHQNTFIPTYIASNSPSYHSINTLFPTQYLSYQHNSENGCRH